MRHRICFVCITSILMTAMLSAVSTVWAAEQCGIDSANGTIDGEVKWKPDYFRTDDQPIAPKDHAGYIVYWTETGSGASCSLRVPDRLQLSYVFKALENRTMNFTISQIDSGGRISKRSNTQVISTKPLEVPVGKPAPVTDLIFTQVDDTNGWLMVFSEVTTYWNGNNLPHPPEKYYVFSTDKEGNKIILEGRTSAWLGDFYASEPPRAFTTTLDVHYFVMETEFKFNNTSVVSDISEVFTLNTVPPEPTPPNEVQWITVPDGMQIQYRIIPSEPN